MSGVATLAATIAAAAGAVAVYRYIEKRKGAWRRIFNDPSRKASSGPKRQIIDFERDPESGVFKPKS